MRCLMVLLVLGIAAPAHLYSTGGLHGHGPWVTKELASPPPGATLPVNINRTLKAQKLRPGQQISVELIQTVPVSANVALPKGANLDGRIINVSDSSISILFDHLSWRGQTVPVHVRLVAAAAMMNVFETGVPLSGPDRGTANRGDWTTQQVGGDQIFLSGGSGTVYDRYSQPVGYADYSGVYANPPSAGELPRAVGPFSTTATGLHGFPEFSIASAGGADMPITLTANKPKWLIRGGSALLLEVVR